MRHIPNILSGIRILLIPLFAWQLMIDNTVVAAVILVVSGLTDLLDGFLARRFGWVSALGKVLDPVADKLTQVTACVVLAIKLPHLWYFFALLLFKELVMLLLGGWLVRKKVKLDGARWFGKVVTTLFYVVAVALIAFPNMPAGVRIALLTLITVCAFGAGLMYIPEFLQYRKEAKAPRETEQPKANGKADIPHNGKA